VTAARAALRDATDLIHRRLHGLPELAALAEGRLGREDYAGLLRRLLGFHLAAEAALAAAPSLALFGIDLAARRRSGLLRMDLAALGAAARPEGRFDLPSLGSAAAALGCLYVTEGSTLGGRELARALDPLLGPDAVEGRRFLLGYGAAHGAMWRACCAAIERCDAVPAMQASALATFGAFAQGFGAVAAPA
jgi:heme oxygenase